VYWSSSSDLAILMLRSTEIQAQSEPVQKFYPKSPFSR